jgi:hypothetical protein
MLRSELIEGVNQVLAAIKDTEIHINIRELARPSSNQPKKEDIIKKTLRSLKNYALVAQNYTSSARSITSIMRIEDLNNTEFWADILFSTEGNRRDDLFTIDANIRFAVIHLPKIVELISKHDNDDFINETINNPQEDLDRLSIFIIEENHQISTLERIVTALQSVDNIYQACAIINQVQPEKLSILSCDSGSDKSFDILGTSKIIECVKDFMLQMYNNIVYFKERKIHINQDLAMRNLEILEKLGNLEKNDGISPEQAELVRRQIVQGVTGLLSAGVITTDIQHKQQNDARQLMAPSPKLLTVRTIPNDAEARAVEGQVIDGPSTQETADMPPRTTESHGLSEEEQAMLRRLLGKMKHKDGDEHHNGEDGPA